MEKIENTKSRKGRVFFWLLLIPIQLVLDVLLVCIGMIMDAKWAWEAHANNPNMYGHGVPALTFLFFAVAVFMTIVVIIAVVIIICVRLSYISKQEKKNKCF